MDDWKEEWEKEQEDQHSTNIFAAVVLGFFALPWWFAGVGVGLFFTVFWGLMFLVHYRTQPHTYEDFAERKEQERKKELYPTSTPTETRRSYTYTSETAGPACPNCGSRNVRKLSGLDVDVDAVDTFVEMNGNIWPVCLHDYMCRQCGHKW